MRQKSFEFKDFLPANEQCGGNNYKLTLEVKDVKRDDYINLQEETVKNKSVLQKRYL